MALWENVIGYGTHADRPAAGAPGALYFESDTGNGYRDNGTTWDRITGIPTPLLTVVTVTGDVTLAVAPTLLVVDSDGHTVTLPALADATGMHLIKVSNDNTVGCTIQSPDAPHLINHDGGGSGSNSVDLNNNMALLWCDGSAWYFKADL